MDGRQIEHRDGETEIPLRTLLDHVVDAMFLVDPLDGRFLDANRPACERLGYGRDELLSMTLFDIDFEPASRNDPEVIWNRLVPGKPVTFEATHRRKDGSTFPLELRAELVEIGGNRRILGLARDISDRKRTEEALHEKEHSLRSLIESMNEGLCLHELVIDDAGTPVDYRIIDVNPAYERILNVNQQAVLGKLASEIYRTGKAPYLEEYARVALSGEPTSFETYFPPLDRHFSISVFSPGPNRFATVFMDITDRKRTEIERQRLLEELEAKNAELERFTYAVSHDLKSPLITLKGFVGVLEEDLADHDSEEVTSNFRRVYRAAETMDRLLDELLELSRVGRSVAAPERIRLRDVVREARDNVAGRIAQSRADVKLAPSLPIVYGDRQRILVVFQNLIDNAVKYMGDQPSPTVEIGAESRNGETVLFVRDNGIGIQPDYREKIFGLFDQLDPKSEGTGVGLALVQRIVEVHHGRIWVESEGEGCGATFYLTLPKNGGEQ